MNLMVRQREWWEGKADRRGCELRGRSNSKRLKEAPGLFGMNEGWWTKKNGGGVRKDENRWCETGFGGDDWL